MKPVQWIIAVVVLVVMVFAVTIIMQFLGETDKGGGGSSTDNNGATGESVLLFPETSYPPATAGHADQEVTAEEGHHDFLFVNPTAEHVIVTLNSTSCTCASVSLLLASEEWKTRAAMVVADEVMRFDLLPAFAPGLPGLAPALAPGFPTGPAHDPGLRAAAAKIDPAAHFEPAKDTQAQYTIPAHAVGWMRLNWAGKKTGPHTFGTELGVKQKSQGVVHLETRMRGVEPVQFPVTQFQDVDCTVEELQKKPKRIVFTFYSTTRKQLHPKATLLQPARWKPEQAPILVGEPQLVPREQWLEMERGLLEKTKEWEEFTCAYQFSVTLYDRSQDKEHPFPFGPYHARIRVSFDDQGVEPVLCYVRGTLHGDVKVAEGTDERIYLGNFPAAEGSSPRSVMLYSDVPDLKLEIDRQRTPAFLTAKIEPSGKDKTAWKLTVRVEPNKLTGSFPRQDDETYYDSALYIQTGDASRSLRIPVWGVAGN